MSISILGPNLLCQRSLEFTSPIGRFRSFEAGSLLIRRERLIVAFATGDQDNVEKILKEEQQGIYREDFLYEHSLIEIQKGRFHSAERLRLPALGQTSKAKNALVGDLLGPGRCRSRKGHARPTL
jgi:hypothetical protein